MIFLRLLIGLVPFGVLALSWYVIRHDSWMGLPSLVFLSSPLLALVAGIPWFVKALANRTPRVGLLCLLASLLFCIVRTDWIVATLYSYMDEPVTYVTFHVPPSPLWSPPTPASTIPGTTSWGDYDYFAGGGAGGPTETPRLRINWLAVISRFWLCLFTTTILSVCIVKRWRPSRGRPALWRPEA